MGGFPRCIDRLADSGKPLLVEHLHTILAAEHFGKKVIPQKADLGSFANGQSGIPAG